MKRDGAAWDDGRLSPSSAPLPSTSVEPSCLGESSTDPFYGFESEAAIPVDRPSGVQEDPWSEFESERDLGELSASPSSPLPTVPPHPGSMQQRPLHLGRGVLLIGSAVAVLAAITVWLLL